MSAPEIEALASPPLSTPWVPLWPLSPMGPSYGTSLPLSPVDGQEAILVDSLTAPTYQWRFRYHAGSTHSNKWEFVGGPPAAATVTGSAGMQTNTVPATLATPAVSIPRTGAYVVHYGAILQSFNANQFDMYLNLFDGVNSSPMPIQFVPVAMFNGAAVSAVELRLDVQAGAVFQQRQWGSQNYDRDIKNRFISVTPVRVS